MTYESEFAFKRRAQKALIPVSDASWLMEDEAEALTTDTIHTHPEMPIDPQKFGWLALGWGLVMRASRKVGGAH